MALVVKNSPANAGDTRDTSSTPRSGRSPGVRKWQPAPVFVPGKFQGRSSLYCFPNNFGGYFTGFQNLGTTTLGQWPGATYEQESLEMSPSAPRLVPTLSTHRLLNEPHDTHKLSALWKRIPVFWSIIVVVQSLCNPWTAAHQASLIFTIS